MTFDEINPFVRGVSLMKWTFVNTEFTMPYDCRIFAIREGNARLFTRNGEYLLDRGSVVFFAPAEPYRFSNIEGHDPFLLLTVNLDLTQNRREIEHFIQPAPASNFDPSKITDKQEIPELANFIILHDAGELAGKVHELYDEYQSRYPFFRTRLSAIATDLLIGIVRRSAGGSSRRERLISSVKTYIHDNFHRRINNEIIAAELGYHPYYLARIFNEVEGVSLHKYLVDCRLRFAMQMLQMTADPIEMIAESCGFSTPAQFAASFKAKYGIVPSDVRRGGFNENTILR